MEIILSPGPLRTRLDRETWEERAAESLCVLYRQSLTEDSTSTDEDALCHDCLMQSTEEGELRDEVERIAAELAEALDTYHRSRRPSRESARAKVAVELLRGVVRVLRQVLAPPPPAEKSA